MQAPVEKPMTIFHSDVPSKTIKFLIDAKLLSKTNQRLRCAECKRPFTPEIYESAEGEQWYWTEPKVCKECVAKLIVYTPASSKPVKMAVPANILIHIELQLRKAGVPDHLIQYSRKTMDIVSPGNPQLDAIDCIVAGKCVLFTGNPGAGKSTYIVIGLREQLEAHPKITIKYYEVPKIRARIHKMFSSGEGRIPDVLSIITQEFVKPDIVVFDEISNVSHTPDTLLRAIQWTIEERGRLKKQTLFVSNRGDKKLSKIYPPSLISRLYGLVGGTKGNIYQFNGFDFRKMRGKP